MTRGPSATLGGQAGKDRPDRPVQASETPAAETADSSAGRPATRIRPLRQSASPGPPGAAARRRGRRRLRNPRPAEGRSKPPRALHGRARGAITGESPDPPGAAGGHRPAPRHAPHRRAANPPGAGPGAAQRSSQRRRRRTRPGIRGGGAAVAEGPSRRSGIAGRRADLQGRNRRGAARFRHPGATDLAPICGKTATPCGRRPPRSGPGRSGRLRRRGAARPGGAIPPRAERAPQERRSSRRRRRACAAFPSSANFFHFLFLFC